MYFTSDIPDPSGPQNQVITGDKVKKKKRKITNLDIMDKGSSDVEEAPKRKRRKRNSEIQETESAPLTGDACAEDFKRLHEDEGFAEEAPFSELADLEGRSKKKKKKSKKDCRDLDEGLVEESLTADTHHAKKKKKKRKDGGGLQGDGSSEELISQRHSPDETPQQGEESGEQSEKPAKKKKKRKDGGGLQGDGSSEELISQRPSPDETPQQGEESGDQSEKPAKKKKKRKDRSHQETDDITADDASSSVGLHQDKPSHNEVTDTEDRPSRKKKKKSKKDHGEHHLEDSLVEELSIPENQHAKKKKKRKEGGGLQGEGSSVELFSQRHSPDETPQQGEESAERSEKPAKKKKKRKDRSHVETDDITAEDASSSVGLHQDKPSHSEVTDTEDRSSRKKKKKSKKDHGEHHLEDNLVEESLATDARHTSGKKTKRKYGGDERQRKHGLTEELVTKRKHQGGPETPKQVGASVDQAEDSLVEELSVPENQHAKKKKKRKDGGGLQGDGSSEELFSQRHSPDETPQQGEESGDQSEKSAKKKKKRKDGGGLQGDGSSEELISQRHSPDETPQQGDESGDHSEKPAKKKKKRKDRSHQETDDITAEDASSSHLETDDITAEDASSSVGLPGDKPSQKKKRKRGGDAQEDGLTKELVTKRKSSDVSETPEQGEESAERSEKPAKKKKKRKDRSHVETDDITADDASPSHQETDDITADDASSSHQETDDITADDASSSAGLHRAKPSHNDLTDTEDKTKGKKKKKCKKDRGERLLEDSHVGKSFTPSAQRISEKTKRKEGGDESHRQQSFTETPEQVAETVDRAEVPAKKKMAKKKHLDRMEDTGEMLAEDDVPAESTKGNRALQSRAAESDVVGDAEETSTSRGSPNQTTSSTGADQNRATQDGAEKVQNAGDKRPPTSAKAQAERKSALRKINSLSERDRAMLEEYIPDYKKKRLTSIAYFILNDMDRMRAAKQEGIIFQTGKFTVEEDELLKKNVEKFVADVGIESGEMLFHPYKFPDQILVIRELKKKYNFRTRIAEGLHRFSTNVFERGYTLYECERTRGRYSAEEVKKLREYSETYKNKWSTVSTFLNRSVASLASKAADIRYDANVGKWSLEEVNRLIRVMKEFVLMSLREEGHNMEEPIKVPKEKLYKGVRWVWVEEHVKTRTHFQCEHRWHIIVLLRMNNYVNPMSGALGIKNAIKIIQWLHDAKVRDPRDVKWDKMCQDIGNIPIKYARTKYYDNARKIDGYKNLRLYEIVDYLYQNVVPELEAKLFNKDCPFEPEKRSEYLLSEIFFESVDGT